ncbi:glycosyltransferase family 91 protein [Penicillium manginii]|jgi:beta-1,2-mannosyltransferase|uniref:glycosyltransferase family 91 protein n=1 Tax=Penicillium manginii TaxID=203109 RepID=UPI0025479C5F|nr:glycosyltransferase family 91 protein [Penicillium manginii]KAJ5755952.1 glycosyltransferase family 91 protein [Penicillium manginii]
MTPDSVNRYLSAVKSLAAKPDFERLAVPGFHNDGVPRSTAECDERRHTATLGVLPSLLLRDNLTLAVEGLMGYPQVDHAFKSQDLSLEDFVAENWAELAGSGVWLSEYEVYIVVTRVIYYPSGTLTEPTISFLRGRIFDALWNHLDNYTLDWDEEPIAFPRMLDIPVTWNEDSRFIGPEDPRVIIEDGVLGAEPVIIFNMLSEEVDGGRAMWVHRPFSNSTNPLTIRGEVQRLEEKNWAPFFHSESSLYHQPSRHLNFIYSLQPLRIMRCHIRHGICDWTFKQELPAKMIHDHPEVQGEMRGSTNFIQVHESDPDISLWVGFARTHLDGICSSNPSPSGSIHRPELVILANSGSEFHIVYTSEALDFGTAVLDEAAREAPCTEGQILIPNGIVRWDQDRRDLLQLALSVNDHTTQVLSMRGVSQLVQSQPYLMEWRRAASPDGEPWGQRWSAVGADVVGCAVVAARNDSMQYGG